MAQNFLSDIKLGDNIYIRLGNATNGDLHLHHNGTNSYIQNDVGHFYIKNRANDADIVFQSDDGSGGVATYYTIDGGNEANLFSKNVKLSDSVELRIGSSNDLKIYHDGSHSYIADTGTGELRLSGNVFRVLNANASETMIYAEQDGKVQLRFNESTKFETTNTGIDVTGDVIASGDVRVPDGEFLSAGNSNDLTITNTGVHALITNYTGNLTLQNLADDSDIIFKSDDGSGGVAEYFRVDGGIVRTVFSKDTKHEDSVKAFFGNSYDLEIYHDGSHSYIKDTGTGRLRLQASTQIDFLNGAGTETLANFIEDGAVKLYYDNSLKLETTSAGATVTGALTVTGDLIVNGTTTTINTATVEVEDNILQLNTTQGSPDTATAATSGISIYRGDGVTQASFIFDDGDDTWDLTNNLTVAGTLGVAGSSAVSTSALTIKSQSTSSQQSAIDIIQNSGTNSIIRMGEKSADGGRFHMFDSGTEKIAFYTDGTANHISAGNLGIGTNAPDGVLDVHGASGRWRVNTYGAMYFRNDNDTGNEQYIHARSDGRLSIGRSATSNWSGTGNATFFATTYDHLTFATNSDATFAGTVSAEDNIHLTDAGTVRAKLLLNASDRDNVELRAESLGSTMKFFTVGTEALELDASQNATFAGQIRTTQDIGRDDHNRIMFSTDDSIIYRVADSHRFRMDSTTFRPYTDSTYDLGTSSVRWANIYTDAISVLGTGTFDTINTGQGATEVHLMNQNIRTTDNVTFGTIASGNIDVTGGGGGNGQIDITRTSGAEIRIQAQSSLAKFGTVTNNHLQFMTNDTGRWNIENGGHLIPVADSSYDIGSNGTRVRNLYADTLYGDGSNLTGISSTAFTGGTVANATTFQDNVTINSVFPRIYLIDNNNNSDYSIINGNGTLRFYDDTNSADRLNITSGGSVVVNGSSARDASNPAKFSVQGGMSEFETTLTNNDDWQNSPISILERGNVGSTQTTNKYSPNLNFHWGGIVSRSLWMDSSGNLNYGEYDSSGNPGYSNGFIRAHEMHAGVFKDKDSTGYYLDPANTGTSLNVAGGATFAGRILSSYTGTSHHELKNATSNGEVLRLITTGDSRQLQLQSDHIFSNGAFYLGSNSYSTNFRGSSYDFANGNATFAGDVTINGGDITIAKQNDAPTMTLLHDGTNPSTNDLLFRMQFQSDYNGSNQNWGKIELDTNASSVRTNMDFYVKSASGNEQLALRLEGQPSTTPKAIFEGDVTVINDLIVNGTTTTVNQTNLDVSDNIIGLNRGASSNANDSGLIIERGSTGDNAAFVWDESIGYFSFGTTQKTPSATGAVANESDWTWKPIKASGAIFTGDVRLPASGKLYTWTGHNDNYLRYDLWRASASAGMTIHNISADGEIYLKSGNALALTLDSSQNAAFAGDVDVGNLRIVGDNSSGDEGKAYIRSNGDYLVLNAADGEHIYLNWDSANGMSGHVYVNTNIYAQAFYDRNDTTYYVDPAAGSNLAGGITVDGNSTFDDNLRVNGWVKGASDTNMLYSSTSYGTLLQTPGNTANNNNSKIFFRDSAGNNKHTFDTNNGNATIPGNITHNGLTMTDGTDIDQVKEFSMTFQLAANTWTDTNIDGADLATGTYIMQVMVDDYGVGGGHYTEYYSATISWFSTNTNDVGVDEIIVHRAGHAPTSGDVQFRTQRTLNADSHDLMLQVKHNKTYSAALDGTTQGKKMIFKFRRLI